MTSPLSVRPSLQFCVPCLGVEESHGPPTLLHVFWELPLSHFPYRFPEESGFFLAVGWCEGRGCFTQRIRLLAPDSRVMMDSGPRLLHMQGDRPAICIHFLQEPCFESPGPYRVEVLLDEQCVLSYTLHLYQLPGESS